MLSAESEFTAWWKYFRRNALVPLYRPAAYGIMQENHRQKIKAIKVARYFSNDPNLKDEADEVTRLLKSRHKSGRIPMEPVIACEFVRILDWAKGDSARFNLIYETIFNDGFDKWLKEPHRPATNYQDRSVDDSEKIEWINKTLLNNPKLRNWLSLPHKERVAFLSKAPRPEPFAFNSLLPVRSDLVGDGLDVNQWAKTWKSDLLKLICKSLYMPNTKQSRKIVLDVIAHWPWPQEKDSFKSIEVELKNFLNIYIERVGDSHKHL